jgi:hypothetical protein
VVASFLALGSDPSDLSSFEAAIVFEYCTEGLRFIPQNRDDLIAALFLALNSLSVASQNYQWDSLTSISLGNLLL